MRANVLGFLRSWLAVGAVTGVPFGLILGFVLLVAMDLTVEKAAMGAALAGFGFGLLFGLAMAPGLRTVRSVVSVPLGSEDLHQRIETAATALALYPAGNEGAALVFKPSWKAGLMTGRVRVMVDRGQARLEGPKIFVDQLVRALSSDTMTA